MALTSYFSVSLSLIVVLMLHDASSNISDQSQTRARRAPAHLYAPVRINVHPGNLSLTAQKSMQLITAATDVANDVARLLSVIPEASNLTLKRTHACSRFSNGTNRCIQANSSYSGEFCEDGFKIPDAHLQQTLVYSGATVNNTVGPSTSGLPSTDFVLYLNSATTTICQGTHASTLSYSSVCQTDGNNRPIAGYINICPSLLFLSSHNLTTEQLKLRLLREFIHALGFNSNSFNTFKNCSSSATGLNCTDLFHNTTAVQQIGGFSRLTTPSAVAVNSAHVSCRRANFGPAMNGSFFDKRLHKGSIMAYTNNLEVPSATYLDNITRAILQDTGWYVVDPFYTPSYVSTEPYRWGQGAGCSFGVNCSTDTYFCSSRLGKVGCDVSHRFRASCQNDPEMNSCPSHIISSTGDCTSSASSALSAFEVFGQNSACFYHNLSSILQPHTDTASCLRFGCQKQQVSFKLATGGYLYCGNNSHVFVRNPLYSGFVECPPYHILCSNSPTSSTTVVGSVTPVATTSSTATLATTAWTSDPDAKIQVEVIFKKANYSEIAAVDYKFKSLLKAVILNATNISPSRVDSITLRSGSIHAFFNLLGSSTPSHGPKSSHVIQTLRHQVANGQVVVFMQPFAKSYVANEIRIHDILDDIDLNAKLVVGGTFGFLALIALVVVGVVCGLQKRNERHGRVSPAPSRAESIDHHTYQTSRTASARSVQLIDESFVPNQVMVSMPRERVYKFNTTSIR